MVTGPKVVFQVHRLKIRWSARFTEIEINDDVAIWDNHYQDVEVITNHFHAEKNYFMTIPIQSFSFFAMTFIAFLLPRFG